MPASKVQTIYSCSHCGAQFSKWNGRCLECGAWGTLEKQTIVGGREEQKLEVSPAQVVDFSKIKDDELSRLPVGISEIDRVLGGGIVPGSLVLLSGEPGIGKSTLVAQISEAIGKEGAVIYVSGEESASQVKSRFTRLQIKPNNLKFINDINVEKIIAAVREQKPKLAIIDSIQTVYSSLVDSEAGGVSQIKASTIKFLEAAKEENIAFILIGHITKDGAIAGPKSLEHIVDTVLYLESDRTHGYRLLRAAKNRFGSVNELGIFEMTSGGFREVSNPSSVFLEKNREKIAGSVVSCILEGTRPFFVEVQALVTKTLFGYPQRKTSGFDLNRLQILSSVLSKRTQLNVSAQDIILNIIGGLRVNDTSLDLAVCLAIVSSRLNQIISESTIVLGEVGLGGEVRNVPRLAQRIKEAEKLGYKEAIIPNVNLRASKIKLKKIKQVGEILPT